MIVHGVVAVHREDSAKRVSVNGVNSNAVGGFRRFLGCKLRILQEMFCEM